MLSRNSLGQLHHGWQLDANDIALNAEYHLLWRLSSGVWIHYVDSAPGVSRCATETENAKRL